MPISPSSLIRRNSISANLRRASSLAFCASCIAFWMADVRSRNSPGKYLRDAQKSTPPITAKFSSTHNRYACCRLSPVLRAIHCTAADCLNSAVSFFSSSPAASRDSRASCRPKPSRCGSDLTCFFCCGSCSCARSGTKTPERATRSRASPQTRGIPRKTL